MEQLKGQHLLSLLSRTPAQDKNHAASIAPKKHEINLLRSAGVI